MSINEQLGCNEAEWRSDPQETDRANRNDDSMNKISKMIRVQSSMGTWCLSTMMGIRPALLVSNRSEFPQFEIERIAPASVEFQAMLLEKVV